jgi:hypothetical protein
VDRSDASRDRRSRVPEGRELREETPKVVQRGRPERAAKSPQEGRELHQVSPVRGDGPFREMPLEREMVAEALDELGVAACGLGAGCHAVALLYQPP